MHCKKNFTILESCFANIHIKASNANVSLSFHDSVFYYQPYVKFYAEAHMLTIIVLHFSLLVFDVTKKTPR